MLRDPFQRPINQAPRAGYSTAGHVFDDGGGFAGFGGQLGNIRPRGLPPQQMPGNTGIVPPHLATAGGLPAQQQAPGFGYQVGGGLPPSTMPGASLRAPTGQPPQGYGQGGYGTPTADMLAMRRRLLGY